MLYWSISSKKGEVVYRRKKTALAEVPVRAQNHQKKERKTALSFGVSFWIKLQAANLKLSEAATRDVQISQEKSNVGVSF